MVPVGSVSKCSQLSGFCIPSLAPLHLQFGCHIDSCVMVCSEKTLKPVQTWLLGFSAIRHYRTFGLFRTSRAREAILDNTLLRKRPGERIQQQPLLFMVEFSTGSADEPTFGMASRSISSVCNLFGCGSNFFGLAIPLHGRLLDW